MPGSRWSSPEASAKREESTQFSPRPDPVAETRIGRSTYWLAGPASATILPGRRAPCAPRATLICWHWRRPRGLCGFPRTWQPATLGRSRPSPSPQARPTARHPRRGGCPGRGGGERRPGRAGRTSRPLSRMAPRRRPRSATRRPSSGPNRVSPSRSIRLRTSSPPGRTRPTARPGCSGAGSSRRAPFPARSSGRRSTAPERPLPPASSRPTSSASESSAPRRVSGGTSSAAVGIPTPRRHRGWASTLRQRLSPP
jgi:hypothetical protein